MQLSTCHHPVVDDYLKPCPRYIQKLQIPRFLRSLVFPTVYAAMRTAVGAAVPKKDHAPAATTTSKKDPQRTMKAVQWMGTRDIVVGEVPVPLITDPKDVIIRVTATGLCGSDLHLYLGSLPGMKKGDIMGHEPLGVVEEVGPEVRSLKKGDRVAVSSNISCGQCFECRRQLYIYCDTTNPGQEQDLLFGHHSAGLLGYTHLTGGYEGGQAEFLRVPFADVSCLKVPSSIPDEVAVTLGDLCPTAWHASELGHVSEGDSVAIWGAGPVGIVAAHCCFVRGADRVVLIDKQQYRLDRAKSKMPHLETINFAECNVEDALKEMFAESRGPDVCIECVGMHYAESWVHKAEMALGLETDTPEIINQMMRTVRKGGRLSVIGDYAGFANHFNLGALMEKGLTLASGMTSMQRYWPLLLQLIQEGKLDPSLPLTHRLPLKDAPAAYRDFNDKRRGCIKVVFFPGMSPTEAGPEPTSAEN